jgi:hypothetical protein
MKIDPLDPANHGRPLWIVYGHACMPSLICAKLRAYTEAHAVLPVGTAGPVVCIWGYSVYKRKPGFRTLGLDLREWSKRSTIGPTFYDTQDEAIERLRKLTKPRAGTNQ